MRLVTGSGIADHCSRSRIVRPVAHGARCSNAKTSVSRCRCSCNGVSHGPAIRLGFLLPPSSDSPEDEISATLADEVADWLATGNWQIADLIVASLSGTLADKITSELDASVGPAQRSYLETSLKGHFLCSLLASLVCAYDKSEDAIPDHASDAISNSLKDSGHPAIYSFAVKVAVDRMWALLESSIQQHFHFVTPVGHAILLARALAVAVCPAPDQHPEVEHCCLAPLEDAAVKAEASEMLLKVVPGWI
jgi:hypothetical protein